MTHYFCDAKLNEQKEANLPTLSLKIGHLASRLLRLLHSICHLEILFSTRYSTYFIGYRSPSPSGVSLSEAKV